MDLGPMTSQLVEFLKWSQRIALDSYIGVPSIWAKYRQALQNSGHLSKTWLQSIMVTPIILYLRTAIILRMMSHIDWLENKSQVGWIGLLSLVRFKRRFSYKHIFQTTCICILHIYLMNFYYRLNGSSFRPIMN